MIAASTSCGDSVAGASKPQGKKTSFRPLAIEICGTIDDPCVQSIGSVLRKYHTRYSTIMRTISTLFSTPFSEDEIFGDSKNEKNGIVKAPKWAVTAKFTVPVISRFHQCSPSCTDFEHSSDGTSDTPISCSHSEICLSNSCEIFEQFMRYSFFPHALTHNFFHPESVEYCHFSENDVSNLIVRHYVHETSRTGSFLVADVESKKAVLIDPHCLTDEYECDLRKFSLELDSVIITHCHVDVVSGISKLKSKFPSFKVWSGLPLEPAGTTHVIHCSELISFTTVAVPSFSPENILVELHLRGTLIALFTGTAWSTDSAPRADLFSSFPLCMCCRSSEESSTTDVEDGTAAALQSSFFSLRTFFRDRYFTTTSVVTALSHRDKIMLLASHGGYNNVTRQLDLYWGSYLGDLVRSRHSKKVLDTLDSLETYTAAVLSAQPLPLPQLFRSTRAANVSALCTVLQEHSGRFLSPHECERLLSHIPKLSFPKAPLLFLDCRDYSHYHRLHLRGAASVPMSFPAEDFTAKRAELWLQCLLLPQQSVIVLSPSEREKKIVKLRIEMISPNATIDVFTLEELLDEWPPFPDGANPAVRGGMHFFKAPRPRYTKVSECIDLPDVLEWVQCRDSFYRLDSHSKLLAVEPKRTSVVVDVRTPSEFKNGSHQYSVPFTLSALCDISARDHLASNCCPSTALSSQLMTSLKTKFFSAAENDLNIARIMPFSSPNDPVGWKEIIFYCAAGYRSLIAISLFRRAFEASCKLSADDDENPWCAMLSTISMSDVPGGAFQLMTQRPDLWQVKDRSIICIS